MRTYTDREMIEEAERMGRLALGHVWTVRLRPERRMDTVRSITGPIVEAHFAYFKFTGRSKCVVWKVVIEAGVSKTRHVVHLSRLPC